ncbi:MAG: hypothetical protein IJT05_08295 [Lachnospiraceae bacterium]|nr:hypothetical protein [Lachnospiraceae bacterium]
MKKAKNIAPLIMLLGGAVTVAVGFIWKLPFSAFVRNLAIALVLFYILGCIVQEVVERNFKEEEPPAEEGGQEGQEETEGASENSEEEREAEENLNTEGSENEGPS